MTEPKKRRVRKPTTKREDLVAKASKDSRGFDQILDDIVAKDLEDRARRLEAMIVKFIDDNDIMRSGMTLEEIRRAGEVRIGADDHRQFLWDGEVVCQLQPLRFG